MFVPAGNWPSPTQAFDLRRYGLYSDRWWLRSSYTGGEPAGPGTTIPLSYRLSGGGCGALTGSNGNPTYAGPQTKFVYRPPNSPGAIRYEYCRVPLRPL